jgi:uncharacterized protein YfaS (alpha-2-macroglobulin family)
MWPGGWNPDPWKSVHATFFLVEAKAKVAVPKPVLARAIGYMKFLLAAPEGYFNSQAMSDSTRAYAAFVLTRAGETPLSWLQTLAERQKDMVPSGRIFLAAAKALHAGNPKALEALDAQGIKTFALDGRKLGYNETLESDLRNLSLRLLAWSYVAPSRNETLELAKTVAEKTAAMRWFTTQDAGMAALALGTYLEKTDVSGARYTAEISAAGKIVASAASGKRLILGAAELPLTPEGNPAPLAIAVSGEGQAYAVYSARGVSLEPPRPVSEDMAVARVWKDAAGNVIDLSGPVKLKKGDRITVELPVKAGRDVADVVVSDLLPGGLEVENPRLKTAAGASPTAEGHDPADRSGASEERGEDREEDEGEESNVRPGTYGTTLDLREDRLLLFIGRLGQGESETYSYSMRAVSAGTFVLPPLAAEGMYNPEIHALTGTGTVIVE